MRSGRLIAASEEELSDLAAWLVDHPDDVTHEVRFEAIDFLNKIADSTATYPCTVYVPTNLVDAIGGVIEDWAEVLFAHSETLSTTLLVIQ
jgi:hypothetical protein